MSTFETTRSFNRSTTTTFSTKSRLWCQFSSLGALVLWLPVSGVEKRRSQDFLITGAKSLECKIIYDEYLWWWYDMSIYNYIRTCEQKYINIFMLWCPIKWSIPLSSNNRNWRFLKISHRPLNHARTATRNQPIQTNVPHKIRRAVVVHSTRPSR